jgi:hypothetical protein
VKLAWALASRIATARNPTSPRAPRGNLADYG